MENFSKGFMGGFLFTVIFVLSLSECSREKREKELTTQIIQDYINGNIKIDTIKTTTIIKIKE